jgi:L-xylulokinase
MEKLLLGLDNGGVMIKAALLPLRVKNRALLCAIEISTPYSGWTWRDRETLWERNCACVRQVIAGAASTRIDCQHRGLRARQMLHAWGKDQIAAYSGILSADNQAWKFPEKWKAKGTTPNSMTGFVSSL